MKLNEEEKHQLWDEGMARFENTNICADLESIVAGIADKRAKKTKEHLRDIVRDYCEDCPGCNHGLKSGEHERDCWYAAEIAGLGDK